MRDGDSRKGGDVFSGRLGLIFATIGAAIGTGNIWRFPRMVGANGGGSFLVPWLIFLFAWSVPLIIAEFAIGKRTRTGTIGSFRIFVGKRFAWMGLWTAWISTAIGFYYAVVTGWCIRYFALALAGIWDDGLSEGVDTTEVWNSFLNNGSQVVLFQFVAILITMLAIWKGAKAIEKVNITMISTLFVLLFIALALAFVMDVKDGGLDGFVYMFSIQPEYLLMPETWINGLSQSAWSCSAGMGMAITYAVYMRKDEDTTLNAYTMCLANNSISIIAGLTVMMAIFSVTADPLAAVSGGSSAITFLVLPEVFAQGPGGPWGQLLMVTAFFLGLSFAALTSLISTVELCVRNFVDHGIDRPQATVATGGAILIFGLPSALLAIMVDQDTGVSFPLFLEVQDHIWGYGLMFSGLFIAYCIWKYGWTRYQVWREENGNPALSLRDYLNHGVSSFRDDFINTGDNDMWIGKWWDWIMYLGFPIMFSILIGSYFWDLISSYDPMISAFDPTDYHGAGIILAFWGVIALMFLFFNRLVLVNRMVWQGSDRATARIFGFFNRANWILEPRPVWRNVPEGADMDISTLPGGEDDFVIELGELPPDTYFDDDGNEKKVTKPVAVLDAQIDAESSAS